MDANKDIKKYILGKSITARYVLNMNEMVGKLIVNKIVETSFRESKPIDAVWATPDIFVLGACVMPTG